MSLIAVPRVVTLAIVETSTPSESRSTKEELIALKKDFAFAFAEEQRDLVT